MLITRPFKSGNSQAIRIPKDYQLKDEELLINKIGSALVIIPKNDPWQLFRQSLDEFSDDYFADGRQQPEMQKREL